MAKYTYLPTYLNVHNTDMVSCSKMFFFFFSFLETLKNKLHLLSYQIVLTFHIFLLHPCNCNIKIIWYNAANIFCGNMFSQPLDFRHGSSLANSNKSPKGMLLEKTRYHSFWKTDYVVINNITTC